MAKKVKTQKKAVKAVADIKPQAPVGTKAVAVVETQSTVARTPISFEWINFENSLITEKLIETVREHTEIIHTLLTSRRKLDIQIASELAILRNQFLAYSAQNGLGNTEADGAFGEYVQTVFNIKASRASEYIRVASKKALQDLKLPISSLCELARLNDEALAEFLVGYPPEEIANMTFREVQCLVQDNNENRAPRGATTKSSGGKDGWTKASTAKAAPSIQTSPITQTPTTVDIQDTAAVITGDIEHAADTTTEPSEQDRLIAVANLRVAFSELKTTVDKLGLDKIITDLLAEISQYYEFAIKNGGV